jgi:hypothetical protein
MVLLFGSLILGAILFGVSNTSSLSPLHASIPPGALAWDHDLDFTGFALMGTPLVLGGLALWLMPLTGYAPATGWGLVLVGGLSFAIGGVWSARAGHAIYLDRVMHRSSSFAPLETDHFRDIRRIEVACSLGTSGRSSRLQANPLYVVVFQSGYELDVWEGGRQSSRSVIELVSHFDRWAQAAGVERASALKPDGTPIDDPGCLALLSEQAGLDAGAVRRLFIG